MQSYDEKLEAVAQNGLHFCDDCVTIVVSDGIVLMNFCKMRPKTFDTTNKNITFVHKL